MTLQEDRPQEGGQVVVKLLSIVTVCDVDKLKRHVQHRNARNQYCSTGCVLMASLLTDKPFQFFQRDRLHPVQIKACVKGKLFIFLLAPAGDRNQQ